MSNVLVVEDEIVVAIELENILETMGHRPVGIASDSRQAMELAAEADLAFVDLNLTDGFTGVAVGRRLARAGVTVLYMSADPAEIDGDIVGTIGVMAKPMSNRQIREAVDYAVAVRGGRPAPAPRSLRRFAA